jgi:mannose-1-phosphate guanylyltransferase
MEERWSGLTKVAIDYAVAEPAAAAGRVAMVPGPFGWEDLGDFASLAALLPQTAEGTKVLGDESLVVASGSSGLVVPAAGRTVAVVGLEDVVVVDTGDALLVTTYAHAQEVKAVRDMLEQRGRGDLT